MDVVFLLEGASEDLVYDCSRVTSCLSGGGFFLHWRQRVFLLLFCLLIIFGMVFLIKQSNSILLFSILFIEIGRAPTFLVKYINKYSPHFKDGKFTGVFLFIGVSCALILV